MSARDTASFEYLRLKVWSNRDFTDRQLTPEAGTPHQFTFAFRSEAEAEPVARSTLRSRMTQLGN